MADDNLTNSKDSEFKCPLCGASTKQSWLDVLPSDIVIEGKELRIAQCTHCNKLTYWVDGKNLGSGEKAGAGSKEQEARSEQKEAGSKE